MRIRIIHWKINEVKVEIERLQHAGFQVDSEMLDGPKLLRSINQNIPDVILIDLSRLPAQGRDVVIHLRKNKMTRLVPLILIDGIKEKVDNIKKVLPDVLYSEWQNIDSALKNAVSQSWQDVYVPKSVFEAYREKDLFTKLGISENMQVDFINCPDNFIENLEPFPQNVKKMRTLSSGSKLSLLFVNSLSQLKAEIKKISTQIGDRHLWILWPKKSGAIISDLSQQLVRQTGLDNGLVDFKICSVDKNWSGLLFRRRKEKNKK